MAVAVIAVSRAQLITWSVRPGVYDKIEPCRGDMFFVYNGSNVGIIKGDGSNVVKPEASRITGYWNGYALVLKSDAGKERVLGILSEDGTYTSVSGMYYTIPGQEFFSEGLLTVTNSQGMAGYMNTKGAVEKQFDVSFVAPFTEGYGTVGEGSDFLVIDRRFNPLQITTGSNSPLYGGTSVYHGETIVWDGNGVVFAFNVKTGQCNQFRDKKVISKKIIENNQIEWDYLGCLAQITGRSDTIAYESPKRSEVTLRAVARGGMFGFEKNGKMVLPCQFDFAEDFHGNYAIVKSNSQVALLSIRKGEENFAAIPVNPEIVYKQDKEASSLSHRFRISVPSIWNVEDLNVVVKNSDGIIIPSTYNNGTFIFNYESAGDKENRTYAVGLEYDGLKLWNEDITYSYKKEKETIVIDRPKGIIPFTVTLKTKNTQADKDNRCYVEAIITNPNTEAITATVTIQGSNLLEAVTPQRITVSANGSKVISAYFKVTKAVTGQKVTISTSAGGSDTLDGLQLIPF